MNFFFLRQQNSCCFRAGKGQRNLTQALKFFNVSWIISAGVAKHFRTCFCVNITQIFFVQKCTPSVVLAEDMFLPVDIVVQSIVKRTFEMLIFLQGFIINNNLPSCTAGIRTGPGNARKFFIIVGKCKFHGFCCFLIISFLLPDSRLTLHSEYL